MRRRDFVQTALGSAALITTGCSSDTPGDESEPDGSKAADGSPTPAPSRQVLVDEVLYTENRFPEDLPSGATLEVDIEVEEGGPLNFAVVHSEEDWTFTEQVDVSSSFTVDAEYGGVHYIQIFPGGRAQVKVTQVE